MRARSGVILLVLALLSDPLSHAGAEENSAKSDKRTLAQKAAARFPQPIEVGTLLGRTVLEPLESQPRLGSVKAIVRRADRSIDAVIEYGGILGFGTRPIAVPIHAMTLMGEYMEIVDFTPKQLDAFPNYDPIDKTPLSPHDVIRVGIAKPTH